MTRSLSITVANRTGLVNYPDSAAKAVGSPAQVWADAPTFIAKAWADDGKWVSLTLWGDRFGYRGGFGMPGELRTEFETFLAHHHIPFIGGIEVGISRRGQQFCRVVLASKNGPRLGVELPEAIASELREVLAKL